MKKSFYIVSLYPYNDVYQVIDNIDDSVVFQGSEDDCKKHPLYIVNNFLNKT
jgi:hypothetical protein